MVITASWADTGMRRSELVRLLVDDIDFEHEQIRVRGRKTNAAKRTIPTEPSLRPLLDLLVACDACNGAEPKCDACAGTGRRSGALLDVPRADGKGGASDLVKKDLDRADLDREDLTRDDADHMPYTFHRHRHTALTHWAVAGRGELFLLTAGEHTDVTMTKRYVAAALSVSARFGTSHSPLPGAFLEEVTNRAKHWAKSSGPQKQSGQLRRVSRNSHVALATLPGSF
jgi:integrase